MTGAYREVAHNDTHSAPETIGKLALLGYLVGQKPTTMRDPVSKICAYKAGLVLWRLEITAFPAGTGNNVA
jgi:hypothetical protein